MKLYKFLLDAPITNAEHLERLRESVKGLVGEDARVLLCENGSDIQPIEDEYFGIQTKDERWVLDESGNIKWYPCREIAEIDAKQYSFETDVVSFNGIDEFDYAKWLQNIDEAVITLEEAKKLVDA